MIENEQPVEDARVGLPVPTPSERRSLAKRAVAALLLTLQRWVNRKIDKL